MAASRYGVVLLQHRCTEHTLYMWQMGRLPMVNADRYASLPPEQTVGRRSTFTAVVLKVVHLPRLALMLQRIVIDVVTAAWGVNRWVDLFAYAERKVRSIRGSELASFLLRHVGSDSRNLVLVFSIVICGRTCRSTPDRVLEASIRALSRLPKARLLSMPGVQVRCAMYPTTVARHAR